jgi:transposase
MREDDRARWTKLVADFESADLSQREFAQERGLSLSNLRYWIYRLRKESRPLVTEATERSDHVPDRAAALEGSRLVPVRVVASTPKARRVAVVMSASDALLELALPSDARIRFPAGTNLAYLRALAADYRPGTSSHPQHWV